MKRAKAPAKPRIPAPKPAPFSLIGRIPVVEVSPVIEGGRWPSKATEGEPLPVHATVFREGHDACAAEAVLFGPDGKEHSRAKMRDIAPGRDRYLAHVIPDAPGKWSFRIEAWSDPYSTWVHDASVKINADVDVDVMLEEGARLMLRAAAQKNRPAAEKEVLRAAAQTLRDTEVSIKDRLAAGTRGGAREVLTANPLRDFVSPSATYPLAVHRKRALYSSWYEIFPRSTGAYRDPVTGDWVSGTLRTSAQALPRIAEMGFDTIYLTPIHPIGTTNRKGPNNTLHAGPEDPGSPYGIGALDGGHDAIHPDLGTFEDFDAFVASAEELGMEVALDIALQCSPDHPWVKEHPQWFTTRADGTIAYAENPPKKYQDIYPLNFDNDPEGIYVAIRDVLEVWAHHGVKAFRVDNPHTKNLAFWQRLIGEFSEKYPDVIFLAEAFTRPAMMRTLGAIGFHQSYTYFTWRNEKEEIGKYLAEVGGEIASHMRPSFWPTTHDILTPYMQRGGVAAFAIRAVLAAMGSPTWGIYNGYELVENVARPGAEEQIDNEKYEYKQRDWARAEGIGISNLLGMLNRIRQAHPSLQLLRNVTVHETTNEQILCFSKYVSAEHSPTGKADTILVVLNLDPYATQEATLILDLDALGVPASGRGPGAQYEVRDELSGSVFNWNNTPFVRLDPRGSVAHIITLQG